MRNLWTDWVEFSIEGEGSDHIHLENRLEEIAISECCRGYKLIYLYIQWRKTTEIVNTLQSWRIWTTGEFQNEENSNWRFSTLVDGITHHIRMMISDTVYNYHRILRIKFFINFFTLRVLFFIDWRKKFLHVLHI